MAGLCALHTVITKLLLGCKTASLKPTAGAAITTVTVAVGVVVVVCRCRVVVMAYPVRWGIRRLDATPLALATAAQQLIVARQLLDRGAMFIGGAAGNQAARSGRTVASRLLLDRLGGDARAPDCESITLFGARCGEQTLPRRGPLLLRCRGCVCRCTRLPSLDAA